MKFKEDPNWRSKIIAEKRPAAVLERVESRVPEEFGELRRKAIQLEDEIFNTATSYYDYIVKFADMMESIEMEAAGQAEQLLPIEKEIRKCKICEDCTQERRGAEE